MCTNMHGTDVSKESKDEGAERIFGEIMAKNIPNLMKDTNFNAKELNKFQVW